MELYGTEEDDISGCGWFESAHEICGQEETYRISRIKTNMDEKLLRGHFHDNRGTAFAEGGSCDTTDSARAATERTLR